MGDLFRSSPNSSSVDSDLNTFAWVSTKGYFTVASYSSYKELSKPEVWRIPNEGRTTVISKNNKPKWTTEIRPPVANNLMIRSLRTPPWRQDPSCFRERPQRLHQLRWICAEMTRTSDFIMDMSILILSEEGRGSPNLVTHRSTRSDYFQTFRVARSRLRAYAVRFGTYKFVHVRLHSHKRPESKC
jgi:hypothetical protein